MIESGVARTRDLDALLRRRLDLLERIGALGSISAAARAVGITYKAAWDAVASINAASAAPLVESAKGGAGGGGARLTPAGKKLVAAFRAVDAERLKQLARLSRDAGELAPLLGWLRKLSMRTSARNQFSGRVARVRRGAVRCEVDLALPGGGRLRATITRESLAALALRPGAEAFALVKASWVVCSPKRPAKRAENVFEGVLETLTPGARDCEAVVRLPGGSALVSVMPAAAARRPGLRVGRPVWASIEPSDVIVGVHA